MNWYLDCWKKYATFEGRARRKEYWMFLLFNFIAGLVVSFVDGIFGTCVFSPLYSLAVILPGLAVLVRRLHDTNRSGWWVLIGFVPFIGIIWILVLTLFEGTRGDNRFGPDPKFI